MAQRPERCHLLGSSPSENKLKFMHGQLSFYPISRIESANPRPHPLGKPLVLCFHSKNTWSSTFDPLEIKNRQMNSKIDLGQDKVYEHRAREREGWYMDRTQFVQREKDHLFSDIFHTKRADEAQVSDRPIARQRQFEDSQ